MVVMWQVIILRIVQCVIRTRNPETTVKASKTRNVSCIMYHVSCILSGSFYNGLTVCIARCIGGIQHPHEVKGSCDPSKCCETDKSKGELLAIGWEQPANGSCCPRHSCKATKEVLQ